MSYLLCIANIIFKASPCNNKACLGSLMGTSVVGREPGTCRPKDEMMTHAKDFFDQYFSSIKR